MEAIRVLQDLNPVMDGAGVGPGQLTTSSPLQRATDSSSDSAHVPYRPPIAE
jgi:hypothetical protein